MHGASLTRALRQLAPEAEINGLGGPAMAGAGCRIKRDMMDMAVMGLWRGACKVFKARRILHQTLEYFDEEPPDALVLVDFPGFNLALARAMRNWPTKVIYYISPQIWAWAPWRIKKIKKRIHKMICILPFEKEIYETAGVPVEYVGHPLGDFMAGLKLNEDFALEAGLKPGDVPVGLLPGSRKQEVFSHLPLMLKAARVIYQKIPQSKFFVPCGTGEHLKWINEMAQGIDLPIEILSGKTFEVMKMTKLCLVKSGTATLQCAYFLTPVVIVYRVGPIAKVLSPLVVRSRFIGLPNLIAGEEIVPEFLLGTDRAKEVAEAALEFLLDEEVETKAVEGLKEVREKVAPTGASRRAAEIILKMAGRQE
jgi:lipid-A-disaccharide synthase